MSRRDSGPLNSLKHALHRVFCAQDFYSSIRMLIWLALVLGITPYHISWDGYHGQSAICESRWGFANAISRWVLFAYCYTYINLHNESLIGYFMSNHISQMSTRMHDIAGIVVALFIFISPLFVRRHLRRALEYLVRIDHRLMRLRSLVNYNYQQKRTLLVILFISSLDGGIITVYLVCLAKMEVHASWQLIFILTYELITLSITICMFWMMALSIKRRLTRMQRVSETQL